jgi:RNA polymerase-binding transcription factor DksA
MKQNNYCVCCGELIRNRRLHAKYCKDCAEAKISMKNDVYKKDKK